MTIRLEKLPKVINSVKGWCPSAFVVGFKLLVNASSQELWEAMMKQKRTTGVDMVVGNDLRDIKNNKHELFVYTSGETFDDWLVITEQSQLTSKLLAKVKEEIDRKRN